MISQEKIKEWVNLYLEHIKEKGIQFHVQNEGYKFKSVEVFQNNFDINAPDLAKNLEEAIEHNNLVASNMNWPRKMLLIFAKEHEKETRSILKFLFDESRDIKERINITEAQFSDLMEKRNKALGESSRTFIELRFLSLLLGFRYPKKYNALKLREWKFFCKYINNDFKIPPRTSSGEKYKTIEPYIESLRKYICDIDEFKEIKKHLTNGIKFKDEEYRWMTQDVIFCGKHLLKDKKNDQKISEKRLTGITCKSEDKLSSDVVQVVKDQKNNNDYSFLSAMKIEPRPITFKDLITGVDKSIIQIPPFQRDFVWTPKEIVYLLDSIYLGYPIGSFIFWKTKKQLNRHRKIGGVKLADPLINTMVDYVLDGQQRITSLYAAVRGATISDDKYNFYFNILNRKFDYKKINEDSENYQELNQPNNYTRIPLEKIFVDSPPDYYDFVNNFPKEYQKLLHELYDRFKEYSFSIIYVAHEDEDIYEKDNPKDIQQIVSIFRRINETGRKLTIVSKMIARCWGEGFDLRAKLNELFDPNEELLSIREETILQISSVILNNKKSRAINILEDTNVEKLEEEWSAIIDAFYLSLDFIKNKIRIKNLKYIPFDSILVPLSYFFYKNHNPAPKETEILFRWFWKACLSNRFSSAVEGKVEIDCNSFDEIIKGKDIKFDYPIDWETFKHRLIAQKHGLRNAFSLTILSLYSYMGPKDFKSGQDIDIAKNFSSYSKTHLHHIFPRRFLDRENVEQEEKEKKDSIVNIAFAPILSNIEMGARAPSDYMQEFSKSNSEFKETLQSHLIGDMKEFGILEDDFNLFLNKRAEKIENKLRSFLGLKTKTEAQFEKEGGPDAIINLLERQMREIINHYLIGEYGEDYWEEAVPQDIRNAVNKKISRIIRAKPYEESKYRICLERIAMLDIMDYFKIISINWNIFKEIFGSRGELERHFLALNSYRRTIKHSKDLDIIDKKNGEAAILWFERIFDNIEF